MPQPFRAFRDRMRRHGAARALFAHAMKATNRFIQFRILRGLALEQPQPAFLRCPPGFTAGFVPRHVLRAFAADPANDLSPRFVERALARGDQCFAIRHGEALASYTWYAFRPTYIDLPDVVLHFQRDWVYMYKGFTHPHYRGQRLYSHGISLALDHYLARGFFGLVAYVESTNFDSLKSSRRTGFRRFGSIVLTARHAVSTPGCTPFGFRLEPSTA
jgi:hypothetical protein